MSKTNENHKDCVDRPVNAGDYVFTKRYGLCRITKLTKVMMKADMITADKYRKTDVRIYPNETALLDPQFVIMWMFRTGAT